MEQSEIMRRNEAIAKYVFDGDEEKISALERLSINFNNSETMLVGAVGLAMQRTGTSFQVDPCPPPGNAMELYGPFIDLSKKWYVASIGGFISPPCLTLTHAMFLAFSDYVINLQE